MQCERCKSGAKAICRVRSDILDMLVCAACAAEARMMGIPVEAWDNKIGSAPGVIRDDRMNVGTSSRTMGG
jgi:hypothetical protein